MKMTPLYFYSCFNAIKSGDLVRESGDLMKNRNDLLEFITTCLETWQVNLMTNWLLPERKSGRSDLEQEVEVSGMVEIVNLV